MFLRICSFNILKGIVLALLISCFATSACLADEGMWLVNLPDKNTYDQMKRRGLKLSPEEIYSETDPSLKDAIVAVDGGLCSGSIISRNGLMITNHHCAYADIHALSTPDNNYLEKGFWAFDTAKEIPIKGKSVTFLKKVVDVTGEAQRIIDSLDRSGKVIFFKMNQVCDLLSQKYDTPFETYLAPMWKGNKYYLYFYETYTDVRLVAAPPLSIGAFGGEKDNWGWPQHRGDFAIYRIYGSGEGKPAEYSAGNVPLGCRTYLKIAAEGVKEGDFTMVAGYPGITNRYISSYELQEKQEIQNSIRGEVRRAKLDIWKKYMDASPQVRLTYQEKYLTLSNSADYAKWENLSLQRYHVRAELQKREVRLQEWIEKSPQRRGEFGNVLENLDKIIQTRRDIVKMKELFHECMIRGSDFILLGQRFLGLTRGEIKGGMVDVASARTRVFLQNHAFPALTEINYEADKEVLSKVLDYFLKGVDERFYSDPFKQLVKSYGGDPARIAEYVFSSSVLTDSSRLAAFFSKPRSVKEIESDPVSVIVSTTGIKPYNQYENKLMDSLGLSFGDENTKYQTALYLFRKDKNIPMYPDANTTMRLSFGRIGGIQSRDGVYYNWRSTVRGILEKYDPQEYEFNLLPDYRRLLEGADGDMGVDFLSDNDITGGNSGSPVLNARGELIGLAFDANRESMCGDVYFKEGYCKLVSVDIRYVCWILEKYAGASNILKELNTPTTKYN